MIPPQDANSPIALRAQNCVLLFDQLARVFEDGCKVEKYQAVDEFARFKLWAGNIGALHLLSIKTSLDFRLQENDRIRERIMGLLDDLAELLEEGTPNYNIPKCHYRD